MEPRALLTFGDSSGNPARTKRGYEDSAHYIIVTATMDMREAQRVDAQVQGLKAKYFGGISPERASFHGYKLLHRLIRQTGNRPRAEQMFHEAFEDIVVITRRMDSTINMVILDKQFPDRNYKTMRTVTTSWAHASYMIRRTMIKSQPDTVGAVMLDRYDDPTNRIVARTMAPFLDLSTAPDKSCFRAAIPRPMFVDSASCNMVQLVDMIAFLVARSKKAEASEPFARLYARLTPHISHTANISAE